MTASHTTSVDSTHRGGRQTRVARVIARQARPMWTQRLTGIQVGVQFAGPATPFGSVTVTRAETAHVRELAASRGLTRCGTEFVTAGLDKGTHLRVRCRDISRGDYVCQLGRRAEAANMDTHGLPISGDDRCPTAVPGVVHGESILWFRYDMTRCGLFSREGLLMSHPGEDKGADPAWRPT